MFIDMGTKTGIAIYQEYECPPHFVNACTIDLKGKRFEKGSDRFSNFRTVLESYHEQFNIDDIWFEMVMGHKGVYAAHMYGGFMAILTSWCYDHKIPCNGIPVQTIKKYVTGKGNATKQDVINGVIEYGFEGAKDDNEADAISMMIYTINNRNEGTFNKYYKSTYLNEDLEIVTKH